MSRTISEKLEDWANTQNRKPLILKGARQIGKTYILQDFAKKHFKQHHYFNFEQNPELNSIFEKNLEPSRIIEELSLQNQTEIQDNDLLIFDEIQYCPKAMTCLKYFYEQMPELAIASTGSLLGLSLDQASYPVGKVFQLEMFPMSFEEFLEASNYKLYKTFLKIDYRNKISDFVHQELWEALKIYFITGGLPEVLNNFITSNESLSSKLRQVRDNQQQLVNNYLADIAKHSGKENSINIERLWKNIPSQLSQEHDSSAPKFKLKGQIPGVKGYDRVSGILDWLHKARLAIQVSICNSGELPLAAFTKENQFKLFMFDIGLLGAILKLEPLNILQYEYGTYQGFFAENFFAQELAYSQNSLEHIYSWKENQAEVEFVIDHQTKVIPIEIKSGWVTQAKSAKSFQTKYNSPYRMIFSAKNINIDKENGILKYPLYLASQLKDILI